MYTDIGGSTVLTEQLGDVAARRLFRSHDAIVREATGAHLGAEVKTLGDGFQLAFDDPGRALAAAVDIQRALGRLALADAPALRVRIGINAGRVIRERGEVLGRTSILAQRVMSAAYPGQVLVAASAAEARPPPGTSLESRGRYLLKGFRESFELFELVDGPLRTRSTARSAPVTLAGEGLSPFVGREPELRLLHQRFAAAARGEPGIVALVGEAGIGKTRLAEEFARSVSERAAVASGRCFADLAAPFQAFRDCLGELLRNLPGWRPRIESSDAGRVAEVFPELATRIGVGAAGSSAREPALARVRMLETLAGILASVSREQPLVLFLDDLHAADSHSLDLLRTLGRRLVRAPRPRILVIVALRESELGRDSGLPALLADLERDRLLDRAALPGLAEAELRVLLRAQSGRDPGARMTRLVAERSAGFPLFAEEIHREIAEAGEESPGPTDSPPERSTRAVRRRLERLSSTCRGALRAASIAGERVPLGLLAALLGRTQVKVAETLGEAIAALVLRETEAEGALVYEFAHPLVRSVLAAELDAAERRRLHLTLAQALERMYGGSAPEHALEIAGHWMRAGDWAPPQTLLCWAARAADSVSSLFAFPEAVAFCRAALSALSRAPDADPALGPALRRKLFWALGQMGRVDEARAIADEAIAGYQALGDRDSADESRDAIAAVLGQHVRYPDAIPYLEAVLARRTRRVSIARALALARYAIALDQIGEGHELRAAARRLRRLAKRLGDPQLEERSTNVLRNWYVNHTPRLRHGHVITEALLASAERRKDVWQTSMYRNEVAFGELLQGRIARALETAGEALRGAERTGSEAEALNAHAVRALCLCFRGDWSAFEQEWASAEPLLGRVPGALRIGLLIWARRRADLWLGRPTPRLRSPRAVYRGMGLAELAVAASGALLAAEQGDERAGGFLASVASALPPDGAGLNWFIAAQGIAAGFARIGAAADAARWYEGLRPYAWAFYLGSTALERARVARLNGWTERAAADLAAATRVFRRERLQPLLALAQEERALLAGAPSADP
jgi:class 3 adenylate cyclase/tetratricopeptide (TPR) repeat protein